MAYPRRPCRSCGAAVVWAYTAKGKRMPVDAAPSDTGNCVLRASPIVGEPPRVDVYPSRDAALAASEGTETFTSHFATCPHAAQHRTRS